MLKQKLSTEMISRVECSLCDSSENKKLFDTFDHEYESTDITFPLVECLNCGLKYLSPRPNLKSLEIIYPKNYSCFSTSETIDQSYVRKVSNLFQSSRIKSLITRFYGDKNSCALNILDVGCGDGNILDRVKQVFPDAMTYGVEPNNNAAALAAKRHIVFEGVFEDYKNEVTFDIIFSSHVIEHVERPVDFLKKIRSTLKDGGLAIIDTPNIDCLQYRIFGKNWGGLHAPRHWTLFDNRSLEDAAKKAGFKVLTNIEMPINIFWIWSAHAYFYSIGKKKFADKYFGVIDCVAKRSLYYLLLMICAEFLERMTGLFRLRLGQQRIVLKN